MVRKHISIILLIVSIIPLCAITGIFDTASATLYRWTDHKGQVHITDYPPSEEEMKKNSLEVLEEPEVALRFDKTLIDTVIAYSPATFRKIRKQGIQLSEKIFLELRSMRNANKRLISGLVLLFHLYYALCLYLVCRKTGVTFAWLAWIPFFNIFPLLNSAGKPLWWGVLFLAPYAVFVPIINSNMFAVLILLLLCALNLYLFIRVWMRVCINFWISKWFSLVVFLPLVQFLPLSYFAFKREPHRDDIRRLRPAVIMLICFLVMSIALYVVVFPG